MTDRRRIEYTTTMDNRGFAAGAKGMMKSLTDLGKKFGLSESFMNGAAGAAAGFIGAIGAQKVAQFAQDGIRLASAAAEIDSKFQAVFGSAKELTKQLVAWGDMAGVTEAEAKNLAATFGNLAQAQGISGDESQKLALKVATLAGDMASFNDEDPSQVFYDLNKALLTSEREGMKKYGIAISEIEVKTKAAEIAAADGRTEVTKADRAYASYSIAVQQAGRAVGDLERTQKSFANQQRQLKASTEELQTAFGEVLLPIMEDLVDTGNDMIPMMKALTGRVKEQPSFWEQVAYSIGKTIGTLGPLQVQIDDTIESFSQMQVAADAAKHSGGIIDVAVGSNVKSLEDLEQAAKDAFMAVSQSAEETAAHLGMSLPAYITMLYKVRDALNEVGAAGRAAKANILAAENAGPSNNPARSPESAGKGYSDATARWNAINGAG